MTNALVESMRELATARKEEEEYSIELMFWKMEQKANRKGVTLDMEHYGMDPSWQMWPLPYPSEEQIGGSKGAVETVKEAAKDGAKKLKNGAKSVCNGILEMPQWLTEKSTSRK